MRSEIPIYPNLTFRIGDLLGVGADSFFAMNFVSSISTTSVLAGFLTGSSSLLIGGALHLLVITTIYSIRDHLLKDRRVDNRQIDVIMKEMEIICC